MAGVVKVIKQDDYSILLGNCVSWGQAVGFFPANYLPQCENYAHDLCTAQLELLIEVLLSLCSSRSPYLTSVPMIYK